VSEYQYYEFVAADQPLTTAQQRELRALSTRARITRRVRQRLPVGRPQGRSSGVDGGVLSAPDGVLVAENQDLRMFGHAGAGEESKPAGDAAEREVAQA
jgi:hypothetical protein